MLCNPERNKGDLEPRSTLWDTSADVHDVHDVHAREFVSGFRLVWRNEFGCANSRSGDLFDGEDFALIDLIAIPESAGLI